MRAVGGLLLALALGAPSLAGPEPASLEGLARSAPLVVHGTVVASRPLDGGRLLVHEVAVGRVLRGAAPSRVEVVEFVGGVSPRYGLETGAPFLLLLEPAPRQSYYRRVLAGRAAHAPLAGRRGVIPVAPEVLEGVSSALGLGAAPRSLRERIFAALGTGVGVVVADAAVRLAALGPLGPLSDAEHADLARLLGDPELPGFARRAWVVALAQQAPADALPLLRELGRDADPATLAAVLGARAALGEPATPAELAPLVAHPDPARRRVAVGFLAESDDPEVARRLTRLARRDADTGVRIAALEALAAGRPSAALPVLAEALGDEDRAVVQGSARALVGYGSAADAVLLDAARNGPHADARRYAALVLMVTREPGDPALRALREGGAPPEVARLLARGIELRHRHGE